MYFNVDFIAEFIILSNSGSIFLFFWILRFFTALGKKEFNTSALFQSFSIASTTSTTEIFSHNFAFSDNEGFAIL